MTDASPTPPTPIWTPVGYLLVGLLSLFGALATLAWSPDLLLSPALSRPVVAIVHLLTLGFVTSTILGSLYLVSGFALRTRMTEGPGDVVALLLYALGTVGMVRGFATGRPTAAAAASPLVLLGLGWVAVRSLQALAKSRLPSAAKAPFVMAWAGLATTAALGLVHAVDSSGRLLGGTLVDRVATHAHFGLVGWVLVLIMAVGNRLLPMIVPSAIPEGLRAWLPPTLTFTGVAFFAAGRLGSFSLLTHVGIFGMVAGVAGFASSLVWMLRNQRRPGRAVPRPDPPRLGALSSAICLLGATALGIALALGFSRPGLVAAYGILIFFGFFAQLIVAIEQRLVPWLFWMRAFVAAKHRQTPPAPYRLPLPRLQGLVLGIWAISPWILLLATLLGAPSGIRFAAIVMASSVVGHGLVLASYFKAAYAVVPRA
ncbi:MAG: hypothetical protein K8J08_20230 [Thermoanaerobaculia bacterium]|nr:hypothetical protein [Thermoanaerobaculia bacterium]